jgi:long-subunit fatty acid transport protein
VAAGAQYRVSDPWLLNAGIAYDSGFQDSSDHVSPLLPVNSAWRFGVGGQQQLTETTCRGVAAEHLCGGTLKTDVRSKPVAIGGRGDLVGSYDNTGAVFFGAHYSTSS